MNSTRWLRVVASGTFWATAYNLVWGVAWLAFMRREWFDATAEINRSLPWNEIWVVWVALSIPLGVATMAVVVNGSQPAPSLKPALAAAATLWLPLTAGMVGWGWSQSLSLRIIGLDSTVNLFALVVASLAGQWSLRAYRRPRLAA